MKDDDKQQAAFNEGILKSPATCKMMKYVQEN